MDPAPPIQWQEPESFFSGDTLIFQRYLPDYLPADGWSLEYTLTQSFGATSQKVATFQSTQSTTDITCHSINVPNFAQGLNPGSYVLSAQVVNLAGNAALNIAAGQKQTIYYAELEIDPDLADGRGSANVATFAETMKASLETKLARLESYDLTETDMQRSRMVVEDKNKTWERYWRIVEFRNYEKKMDRQKNTGQNQNSIMMTVGAGW